MWWKDIRLPFGTLQSINTNSSINIFNMRLSLLISISILLYSLGVNSNFLGRRFSPPSHLADDDSLVAAGWKNLSSTIDAYLQGRRDGVPSPLLAGLENLTFSLGMFSIHDPAAQTLQYHYTSEEVATGKGVDEVDGNSIYRVASISKLFSVYAGMLLLTEEQWNQPITDFVPGLSKSSLINPTNDPIHHIRWEDVTLRALASQISGIPRDAQPVLSDIALDPLTNAGVADPISIGLPPLDLANDPSTLAPCLTEISDPTNDCTADLYFEGTEQRLPTFQSWTTPAYTDNGFILFGIALANITGKPIAQVYPDAIFDPLGMRDSRSAIPPESEWSQYVIPVAGEAPWGTQGGISISSGGLLASLNDLARFGTALLNSTLLPTNKTRQWLKPISHTAQFEFSIGTPWEIYRYKHVDTGAITDIYTKLGDSGNFTGFVCLIPDFDAGFNILTSSSQGTQKSILASTLADLITTTIIPTLESQAAFEAEKNFAGIYTSEIPGFNSSLTISFLDNDGTTPGLYITHWISNTTLLNPLLPLVTGFPLKLQPSISQGGQRAFLARPVAKLDAFLGPFGRMVQIDTDWLYGEGITYGGIGFGVLVFDVDEEGRAGGVNVEALRVRLVRGG